MAATLTVTPNPAPVGSVVSVVGAGFLNRKVRLTLDGQGATTNIFRPLRDGTFQVGITVASTVKSQTLVAQQYTGGAWRMVARLAPLLTFAPPSGLDTTAPVIVNQPTASNITSTTALISWSTNEPSSTKVNYGTTGAYGTDTALVSTLVLTHNITLTGLTPSTLYHYRVRSIDGAGNETVSGDFTFTSAGAGDTTAPVPSNIVGTALTSTTLQVAWDFTPADTATGQVQYGLTTAYGSTSTLESGFLASHRQVISGLTAGATYNYRVKSADASGNIGYSTNQTITMTTDAIVTLTSANTKSQFEAACAVLTTDIIELASGTYTWQDVHIDVDRTSNPLTIRPALGATVYFVGPATTTGIILSFGHVSISKYITLDGRAGGVGTGSSMVFKDIALAQSGVIELRGSDHLTFQYLTFQNLSRDLAIAGAAAFKSWCFYISSAGAGNNDNVLLDNCYFKAPAVYRDVSCLQIASSGSHGTVTMSNVLEMTNYHYSLYVDMPVTALTLLNWVMTDCGRTATPASIRFTAVSINGSYTNIDATLSSPLLNNSTGTMTDGGGNSGI